MTKATGAAALAAANKQAKYLQSRLAEHRAVLLEVEVFLESLGAADALLDDVREVLHGAAKRVRPKNHNDLQKALRR